jgi:uncharacterized protein YfaA (DUF2138 family)
LPGGIVDGTMTNALCGAPGSLDGAAGLGWYGRSPVGTPGSTGCGCGKYGGSIAGKFCPGYGGSIGAGDGL